MKMRSLLGLMVSLSVLGASFCHAVLAEDDSFFRNLSKETLSKLNGGCQSSTEVNYHSQKLTSPNGGTSAYFNVVVRRVGQSNSRPLGGDYIIKCDQYRLETPTGEIILMSGARPIKINMSSIGLDSPYKGYFIINPISFSLDSRYLITRLDVSSNGIDAWTSYLVLDSKKKYQALSLSPCQDGEFGGTYKGFISPTEITFDCSAGGSTYSEVLNLQRQSIRRVSNQFSGSDNRIHSYGSVSSQFAVVKTQQFPRK